ncbi:MAG: FkbM family methyltransferase [Bacteroidia bacterium]
MRFFEKLKLQARANRYKNKTDAGGISFVLSSVNAGQTVMDIGAHKGGYLYFLLKKTGPSGKIFAFEPQSSLFHYLGRIKELFGWENVSVEHLALSDKAGTTTLYIPQNTKSKDSSPGATIVSHPERTDNFTAEVVSTETLDNYCSRKNIQPDFLKIDVEGNELRIFKGGIETLKKCKPKIIVEIEARHVGQKQVLETFEFLENLGYTGKFIFGKNRFPLKEFNFDMHQNLNFRTTYCNNFTFE